MEGASLSRGEQHPTGNIQVPNEDIAENIAMPTTSFLLTVQLSQVAVAATSPVEIEQQQSWTKNLTSDHSFSRA